MYNSCTSVIPLIGPDPVASSLSVCMWATHWNHHIYASYACPPPAHALWAVMQEEDEYEDEEEEEMQSPVLLPIPNRRAGDS